MPQSTPFDFRASLDPVPRSGFVAIYALDDPVTGEMRYIGRSTNVQRRLCEHCGARGLRENTPRVRWIRSLLQRGVRPTVRVLMWTVQRGCRAVEHAHIVAALDLGYPLTNVLRGGEGCEDYSDEQRRRQAEITRERMADPVFRAIAIAAMHSHVLTDEERQRRKDLNKGRKHTVQARANMAAAKRGTKATARTRERMSQSQKERRRREQGRLDMPAVPLAITAAEIPLIRTSSEPTAVLAERYDVARSTIRRIKRRETWREVS